MCEWSTNVKEPAGVLTREVCGLCVHRGSRMRRMARYESAPEGEPGRPPIDDALHMGFLDSS